MKFAQDKINSWKVAIHGFLKASCVVICSLLLFSGPAQAEPDYLVEGTVGTTSEEEASELAWAVNQAQARIVNGNIAATGEFPFAAALRTRFRARVEFSGQSWTSGRFFMGDGAGNLEAESVYCGIYADEFCTPQEISGRICFLFLDYARTGVNSPETPSQQVDRCASSGGVGVVFFDSQNGNVGIDDVADAVSSIPVARIGLSNGDFSEFAEEVFASTGTVLKASVLVPSTISCTGSYLGNRWVLTAAHCVATPSANQPVVQTRYPRDWTVVVGVNDMNSDQALSELSGVAQIVVSPDYRVDSSGTQHGDWALMRLSSEPRSGSAIKVASVQAVETGKSQFSDVTLIGWGSKTGYLPGQNPTNPDLPSDLHHAVVSLTDTNTCNAGFASYGSLLGQTLILDEDICHARQPDFNADSCQGDSGGPVTMTVGGETQLVGVTSWGVGCASGLPDLYSVSTGPSYYADKISAAVGFNVSAAATGGTVGPATGNPDSDGSSSSGGGGMLSLFSLFALLLWLPVNFFGKRRRAQ